MSRQLIIRSKAEADLAAILEWYDAISPATGAKFLTSVEAALALIEHFPEIAPVYHAEYHRKLLPGFPYGIFYILRPDLISIGAVFHLQRDPDWIKRQLKRNR